MVGTFSAYKIHFAPILPTLQWIFGFYHVLYLKKYINTKWKILKTVEILTNNDEQHLNYLTYPWISAPFGEISVWSVPCCIWNIFHMIWIKLMCPAKILDALRIKTEPTCLPNASTSGSWHINLVTMSVFLISEMWYQLNLPLLSVSSTLLPWIQTTLKSTLYLGMKHLLVWSLTSTRSPTSILSF